MARTLPKLLNENLPISTAVQCKRPKKVSMFSNFAVPIQCNRLDTAKSFYHSFLQLAFIHNVIFNVTRIIMAHAQEFGRGRSSRICLSYEASVQTEGTGARGRAATIARRMVYVFQACLRTFSLPAILASSHQSASAGFAKRKRFLVIDFAFF